MALVKNGRVTDDSFVNLADADALPASGAIIVSLKRFQEHRDALLLRSAPLGVRLEAADSPETLAADAQKLALVAVTFPGPRDGRAFSQARVLRDRMKFTGEIRVTGHYLRDHIAFLTRVGVDAFELRPPITAADFEPALHELTNVYQPSVDHKKTIWELRRGKRSK